MCFLVRDYCKRVSCEPMNCLCMKFTYWLEGCLVGGALWGVICTGTWGGAWLQGFSWAGNVTTLCSPLYFSLKASYVSSIWISRLWRWDSGVGVFRGLLVDLEGFGNSAGGLFFLFVWPPCPHSFLIFGWWSYNPITEATGTLYYVPLW